MSAPVLRIERVAASGTHRMTWRNGSGAERVAEVSVSLAVSEQQHEDLRWYLEEYAEYSQDPAPRIARRVEQWMDQTGAALFAQTLGSAAGAEIWREVEPVLAGTRVEIAGVDHPALWLLLRAPGSRTPVAMAAQSFVQADGDPSTATDLADGGPLRVLVVISRPRLERDVPFRSVAAQLLREVRPGPRLRLDVLRPPTMPQLQKVLSSAAARGEPYHAVHFDGHGVYTDPTGNNRPRGFVLFENPGSPENRQLVQGAHLSKVLKAGRVPVLMLNACRSAHAESQPAPQDARAGEPVDRTRAYGSFAEEVVRGGVAGVVAMSFNVYVVTAARFMANLYRGLSSGATLGEAVAEGRRRLFAEPQRAILQQPVALQDWVTPLVYEAAPMALCGESPEAEAAAPGESPFVGMDDTLLAIDRGFDGAHAVLLHGYAGSGKTTTAKEFANWYRVTGGLGDGPVMLTTFDRHIDLAAALDQSVEPWFGKRLQLAGRDWLKMTTAERRQAALDLFAQTPVLWIWDNVEPLAGFPDPADSSWSDAERAELLGFLREAAKTKARFLLTSRRAEEWLGDVVERVAISPLPMLERFQLARLVARQKGLESNDIAAWRPLLEFTAGNPLAIVVLVKQALAQGYTASPQLQQFIERVREGEAVFADDEREGRSQSLAASLRYGFEAAFSDLERAYLSLLHLFRGAVNPLMLSVMCERGRDWQLQHLPELSDQQAEQLVDRAAGIGLLSAAGWNGYTIHPALPWFFRQLFAQYHGDAHLLACRYAYANAVGRFSEAGHNQYNRGQRDLLRPMHLQEGNLLHARRICLDESAAEATAPQRWYPALIGNMDGLRILLEDTGRWTQWWSLVEEIVPRFVDPATDQPRAGLEPFAEAVNSYRHRIATQRRQWSEAERLQRQALATARERVNAFYGAPPETLTDAQRDDLQNLSLALQKLGNTLLETQDSKCIPLYEEAVSILVVIGRAHGLGAECATNLATAYKNLAKNLDLAETWYQRSLRIRDPRDRMGAGETLMQLGNLYNGRFQASLGEEPAMWTWHRKAVQAYEQSLVLLPAGVWKPMGAAHQGLGFLYSIGNYELSMHHYREAVRCYESDKDWVNAGSVRILIAQTLESMQGRTRDALEYAEAAVRVLRQDPSPEARQEEAKAQKMVIELSERSGKAGGASG